MIFENNNNNNKINHEIDLKNRTILDLLSFFSNLRLIVLDFRNNR